MFRTVPLPAKIEPLLLAFAEAPKSGMPALEEAELFAYLVWQPAEERRGAYEGCHEEVSYNQDHAVYRWGVTYAPGKDGGKGLLTWQVRAWRPHEDVMRAIEALGVPDGGVEAIWEPFDFLDIREEDLTVFH
jgi:hypothetical protein